MPKPKGGRGQRAPYQTKLMRIPVPLEQQIGELVERYQKYLDSSTEPDVNNPPQLLDSTENNFNELYKLLDELAGHVDSKDTGYKANSFTQGIKDIKEIISKLKPVNR